MTHITSWENCTRQEINNFAVTMQTLSDCFYGTAHTQEHFINDGILAGQSVEHIHGQVISYEMEPLSMPERMKAAEFHEQLTSQKQFQKAKKRFEFYVSNGHESIFKSNLRDKKCLCCTIQKEKEDHADNFVIGDFEHNFVCLSHHPGTAGEVSIVPHQHANTIKDLKIEALQENMVLAAALLPIMKEYTNTYMRGYGNAGCNMYIKNIGEWGYPRKEFKHYHVHTRIMSRTQVPIIPGNIDGNSCKLDYNPMHLFEYLLEKKEYLAQKVNS